MEKRMKKPKLTATDKAWIDGYFTGVSSILKSKKYQNGFFFGNGVKRKYIINKVKKGLTMKLKRLFAIILTLLVIIIISSKVSFLKEIKMGILDYIARQIATTGQVWGMPEMEISEKITGSDEQTRPFVYGSITGRPGAYIDPNDPNKTSSPDYSTGQSIDPYWDTYWNNKQTYDSGDSGSTLGASTQQPTGDSGGSNGGGPSTAEQILQARLNLIRQRWDEAKRQASNWLSRAGETRTGALGDIRDTTSMIKGNAIRTANDIETKNRMAARALGYGTSSAFERSMRKMGEGLSRTMGGINLDQAQGRRQVNDRYAEAENQARALENTGLSQFGDDTTSALGEFASRLDAIKQANDLIAATKGQYGQEEVGDRQAQLLAGLNNLQDFGTGLTGMNYANQPVATNVAQPTDIFSTQDDLKNKGLYSGLYV
jgi:hypothetical protein